MYLLPRTLQEEIVRSANMSREDRLMKAVLSFKLFIHYFSFGMFTEKFRDFTEIQSHTDGP
jgi:hypothetical protein